MTRRSFLVLGLTALAGAAMTDLLAEVRAEDASGGGYSHAPGLA